MKEKQLWKYNAGDTWNPVIFTYCQKHQDEIEGFYDPKQSIDLQIDTPTHRFILELKGSDLHASLFPHGDTSNQTSLKREMNEHYIPMPADYKLLVCCNGKGELTDPLPKGRSYDEREAWKNGHRKWMYDELDYFTLINQMSAYPEVIVKIYETQQSAIQHIHAFTDKIDEPVELNKPVYVTVKDWSLAQQLSAGIKGFSLEFAQALVEHYGLQDWDDCVKTLSLEGSLEFVWGWDHEKDMAKSLAKEIRERIKRTPIKDVDMGDVE